MNLEIFKMLKDVKTGTTQTELCKRYEDFIGFDLMSIRLMKDQRNNVVVSHSF